MSFPKKGLPDLKRLCNMIIWNLSKSLWASIDIEWFNESDSWVNDLVRTNNLIIKKDKKMCMICDWWKWLKIHVRLYMSVLICWYHQQETKLENAINLHLFIVIFFKACKSFINWCKCFAILTLATSGCGCVSLVSACSSFGIHDLPSNPHEVASELRTPALLPRTEFK